MHYESSKRIQSSASLVLAVLGLLTVLLLTGIAHAACGDPGNYRPGSLPNFPLVAEGRTPLSHDNSIVGLWHVVYSAGGQEFYEAFDQWHSDGTEFENAYVPSVIGNICFGVWKQDDNGDIVLNHIGWSFDPDGTPDGYFTLKESNHVNPDGNGYKGKFGYKAYDGNGSLIFETNGTQVATRISIH